MKKLLIITLLISIFLFSIFSEIKTTPDKGWKRNTILTAKDNDKIKFYIVDTYNVSIIYYEIQNMYEIQFSFIELISGQELTLSLLAPDITEQDKQIMTSQLFSVNYIVFLDCSMPTIRVIDEFMALIESKKKLGAKIINALDYNSLKSKI